jgi:hypothetical protein
VLLHLLDEDRVRLQGVQRRGRQPGIVPWKVLGSDLGSTQLLGAFMTGL